MADEEGYYTEERKANKKQRLLVLGCVLILVIGMFMLGANVSCTKGGGELAGFSCVQVTRYGVCEFDGNSLIVERDGVFEDGVIVK